MSSRPLEFVIKLADKYHELAKKSDVLCTASVDEVMRFLRAVSDLAEQGVEDPDVYMFILRSSLVKLPECERFYEEALKQVGFNVGGGSD